jgi:hypothetical protein
VVILALIVCAVLSVLQGLNIVSEIELLSRIKAGDEVLEAEAVTIEERIDQLVWLQLGAFLFSGILFITWFHRAYANVAQWSPDGTEYATKWAVIGWLIPILHVVRPYQIAKEIWTKCCVRQSPNVFAVAAPSDTSLIGYWWGATLLMGALDRIGFQWSQHAETIEQALVAGYIIVASESMTVIAAFIAMSFVRELSARHERAIRSYQSPIAIDGLMQTRMS